MFGAKVSLDFDATRLELTRCVQTLSYLASSAEPCWLFTLCAPSPGRTGIAARRDGSRSKSRLILTRRRYYTRQRLRYSSFYWSPSIIRWPFSPA